MKQTNHQFRFLNQTGVSLMELVVSVGLASVVFLTSAVLVSNSQKNLKKQSSDFWLEVRRSEILLALTNDASFTNFVNFNGSPMTCLLESNVNGCNNLSSTVERPFKLQVSGASANNVLDGNSNSMGFTEEGEICNSFSAINGNNNCPYGISLKWTINCQSSQLCRNPEAKFAVDFKYNPQSGLKKEMSRYKISIVRGQKVNSVCQTCVAMGGVCTSGTTCDLSSIRKDCNTVGGEFLTGFDADGKPICTAMNYAGCPSGQVATGFASDGSILCSAGCSP